VTRSGKKSEYARLLHGQEQKNSILGINSAGLKLEGDYFTAIQVSKEKERKFLQLSFTDINSLNSAKNKKQLVSLLGKDKLPQSLVKADSKYIVSDKHPASNPFR
jgi:adenine-specific DNA-methyltransferase